jgi:hypothetical protein
METATYKGGVDKFANDKRASKASKEKAEALMLAIKLEGRSKNPAN